MFLLVQEVMRFAICKIEYAEYKDDVDEYALNEGMSKTTFYLMAHIMVNYHCFDTGWEVNDSTPNVDMVI